MDTDFTVFLKKLMMFLYRKFGNRAVHTEELRALYGEKNWKKMRINIEKLVRRGMIERKINSRFDSEYRMLVDPKEQPNLFFSDDGEAERAPRQYTGSASYAGPAVSYAAAGV